MTGSRAPSQRPHSSAAKAGSLGKGEGGLWRRVIAGQKRACIAGWGTSVGFLPAARNLLKVWLLLIGFCAALGGLGWLVGGYRTASITIFCILLAAAALYWYLDRVAPGMVGARELVAAEAPLFRSTVERLAARAGVAQPRIYLLADQHPRAFVAGRGPRGSSLAVSEGLLMLTTAAELAGVFLEMSRLGGWLERMLLLVLGPIAAAFVHLFLSPSRELAADRAAAEILES